MIVSFPTRSLPQKNARTQHTKPKKTRKHNFFYSVLKDIVSECRTMRPSGRRVSRDKTERMGWTGWILATAKWGSDGLDWLDSGWILELPDVPLSLLRPKKDDLAYYRRTSLALTRMESMIISYFVTGFLWYFTFGNRMTKGGGEIYLWH